MPVEIFTKEQFEAALPVKKDSAEPAWTCLGLHEGEYAYIIPVSKENNVGIHVRSSVKGDGMSADCGQDSIRAWIVDLDTGMPMGGKISRWTTREKGWQRRLWNPTHADPKKRGVLYQLRDMAIKIVPCPKCGKERLKVFKVKKEGPNHGRPFRTCKAGGEGCGFFEFLDEEPNTPAPAPAPTPAPANGDNNVVGNCPKCGGVVKLFHVKKEGPNKGRPFHTCHGKNGDGCGYFQWMDQQDTPTVAPAKPKITVYVVNGQRVELPEALVKMFANAESITIKKELVEQ